MSLKFNYSDEVEDEDNIKLKNYQTVKNYRGVNGNSITLTQRIDKSFKKNHQNKIVQFELINNKKITNLHIDLSLIIVIFLLWNLTSYHSTIYFLFTSYILLRLKCVLSTVERGNLNDLSM